MMNWKFWKKPVGIEVGSLWMIWPKGQPWPDSGRALKVSRAYDGYVKVDYGSGITATYTAREFLNTHRPWNSEYGIR